MHEPGEEWEEVLFQTAPQVKFQMIEHLQYSLIEIITRIQLLTSIKRKVWINSLPSYLKVITEKQMFLLV